jgi:hypothetical protein
MFEPSMTSQLDGDHLRFQLGRDGPTDRRLSRAAGTGEE